MGRIFRWSIENILKPIVQCPEAFRSPEFLQIFLNIFRKNRQISSILIRRSFSGRRTEAFVSPLGHFVSETLSAGLTVVRHDTGVNPPKIDDVMD